MQLDRTDGHIDLATDAGYVAKSMDVLCDKEILTLSIILPQRIWDGLTSADWDKIEAYLSSGGAEEMLIHGLKQSALKSGVPDFAKAAQFVVWWVHHSFYKLFTQNQIAKGNEKWLVPISEDITPAEMFHGKVTPWKH